jgi:ABC-2 type transport system permease protein
MITMMMSMVVAVPAIMFVMRARGEEKDIRAELIVAAPVSRAKYLAGYAAIAFAATALIQFMWAIGMYAVGITILPEGELSLSFMMKAFAVNIPAIWVMVGAAILLVGLLPKYTGAIWGYFGFTFFFMMFGRMGIFEWAAKLTPFGYVPNLPMDEINFAAMAALTLAAAGLAAAGFVFYGKRDMNAITHS